MTEVNEKVRKELNEFHAMDQKLQNILMQKHGFQTQLLEIENALVELKDAKEAYKILGNIIVSSNPKELKKELESKKEILEIKLKKFVKEEEKIRKNAEELQKKILSIKK